jgi:hypothetical protein
MDGIVFKGEKIVVSPSMRNEMLQIIHSAHFGMEKCKQRARDVLFWVGMAADIERIVSSCQICKEKQRSNTREPLQPHEVPERPWQKVATDLFQWQNKHYLLTVDYYSRYFEVDELTTTTSLAVIRKMSAHFARHGIPEVVISDNGTQYTSAAFADFAKKWDFRHVTVSPKHPQSNGLAEKYVQIVKNILEKSRRDGNNVLRGILEYRASPVDNMASPAQLLFGRQIPGLLPTSSTKLQPKVINPTDVRNRRHQMQQNQKAQYDKKSKQLPPLKLGENVYIQKENKDWEPATIINTSNTDRSYHAQTRSGNTFRRNRVYFRK